jgi:hypothetical protein
MKKEIFESQKKIYHYMRRKALNYEHYYSPEIQSYQENYEQFSLRPFESATIEELYETVFVSDIIYLGDFHTFDQNLKNFLRLTQNCIQQKIPLCFALEMLMPDHIESVDAYFQGDITELEFLENIKYHDSWRFPWTHYKKIFELAKKFKIPVVGLGSKGNIKSRDEKAAALIVQTKKKLPNHQIFVFFGEYHIVPNKLPALVQKKIKVSKFLHKIDYVIIHQNLEGPYWKIVQNLKSLKSYKILKFNKNEYCIISSPPWMKYESMCYWYENLMDDPDYDIHEYIIENGLKIFTGTTQENFELICKHIIKNFKLKIDQDELNYNIYDHSQLEFIENEINSLLAGSLRDFYLQLIESNQSFIIPKSNRLYCSNYSINRLAKLASLYLLSLNRPHDIHTKLRQKSFFFYYFLHQCMISYFWAKSINPYLKCNLYADIKKKLKKGPFINQQNGLYLSKLYFDDRTDFLKTLPKLDFYQLYEIATTCGEILGENLYLYIHRCDEKKALALIHRVIKKCPETKEEWKTFEKKIIAKAQFKEQEKTFF